MLCGIWDRCSAQVPGLPSHGFPFGNSPDQLRIVVVSDEGPALFVPNIIFGVDVLVLDKGPCVFHVAVNGLYGRFDAFLLSAYRY